MSDEELDWPPVEKTVVRKVYSEGTLAALRATARAEALEEAAQLLDAEAESWGLQLLKRLAGDVRDLAKTGRAHE